MLQGYSRDVVAADNMNAIVSITSQAVAALFQVPVVVMLVTEDKVVSVNRVGGVEPQEAEFAAARSSLATGTVARAKFYPTFASRFDFWPVATAMGQSAIIGVHSMPANVLNYPIRWLTSLGVFWRWRFIVSISRSAAMLGPHVNPEGAIHASNRLRR